MELNEIEQFVKGKRVLITGHTGFVGAWLCAYLYKFGADLYGFSLPEEPESLYAKIKNKIYVKDYYGDISSKKQINKCVQECKPEIVIHNAAFVFILKCEKNPWQTFATNVMGTVNLLEAIRNCDCVHYVIGVSSDKVYENEECDNILFSENDVLLAGGDPYSCSKTCQDIIIQSYYETYLREKNIGVALFRPSNMIGGGDHHKIRLIPSIIESFKKNVKLELRNPNAIRPWQDIIDVMDAYMRVLISNWDSKQLKLYNLGPTPENVCSVLQIVQMIESISNEENSLEIEKSIGSNIEKQYLGLSIEKIVKEEKWKPKKSLYDSINDLYRFYASDDGENTYDLMSDEINRYYETSCRGEI